MLLASGVTAEDSQAWTVQPPATSRQIPGESNICASTVVVCRRDSAASNPRAGRRTALPSRSDRHDDRRPSRHLQRRTTPRRPRSQQSYLCRGRGPRALPRLRSNARRRRELALDQHPTKPRPCRTRRRTLRRSHHPPRADSGWREVGRRRLINHGPRRGDTRRGSPALLKGPMLNRCSVRRSAG